MFFPDALMIPVAIDHVGYGVEDLSSTVNLFNKLGFVSTEEKQLMIYNPETDENGPLGQLSAHIMFENGYIELSAPTGDIEDNHLIPLVKNYSGIHILALACANAKTQHEDYQQQYKSLSPMAQASRKIEYGNQQGTARFNWFPLPNELFSEGIVCIVEHLTRDLVFQKEILTQANKASGLVGVTLYSTNIEIIEEKYKPLLSRNHNIPHVHNNSYLRILSDADLTHNEYDLNRPPKDCALMGLDIEVASLKSLKNILLKNKVNFLEHSLTELIVNMPFLSSFIIFSESKT